MATERRYCTFELAGLWFGIEVEKVQEVVFRQPMTRVPRPPYGVAGLVNLRGQIVTAIHTGRCLGLPEAPVDLSSVNLIVLSQPGQIGLLVGGIDDVVAVRETDYEPAPENLPAEIRQMLVGIYKLPGRLLHALAVDAVISRVAGGSAQS